MIFLVFISTLIIAYCIIRLLDIKGFVHYLDSDDTNMTDSIFIIFTLIWFVFNVFLSSGVFVIAAGGIIISLDAKIYDTIEKKIRYARIILWTVIATNAIIVFNTLYLKLNIWEQLFNLCK